MNSPDGFFSIILALLDDTFKDADNNDNNSNGFDSMMNFQQFERVESAKCCVSQPTPAHRMFFLSKFPHKKNIKNSFQYMKLTRNEKIDRLFVVLNLLVKLMEMDLSLWMQRYPFQIRNFMSNPDTCPLIVHLLWKGRDCGEMNGMLRDVLKLFTTAVWIDFPNDKTDILAVS